MKFKKIKNTMIAGAVVMAVASGSALALAASASKIGPGGTSAETVAIDQLTMAQELVAYGDANKDALSLILAARVLKANPTHPVDATKATEGTAGKEGTKNSVAVDNSVAAILTRAKQYATGRKDLIALADDVATASSKGRIRGPARTVDRVSANDTDVWPIRFRGSRPAVVTIRGDGDTDLDFYVYDDNGNLGPYDNDSTDYTRLSWTPTVTSVFYIKVINRGGVYNRYTLTTN